MVKYPFSYPLSLDSKNQDSLTNQDIDQVTAYKLAYTLKHPEYEFTDPRLEDLKAMVSDFIKHGVTVDDFIRALSEQDSDPRYTNSNKPRSYQVRAMRIAKRRVRLLGLDITGKQAADGYDPSGVLSPGQIGQLIQFRDLAANDTWLPLNDQGAKIYREPEPIPGSEAYEIDLMHAMEITDEDIAAAIAATGKPIKFIRFDARDERNKRRALERAAMSVLAEV